MNAGVRRDDTQTLHVSQSSDVTTQRYDERCRLSVALVELFLAGSGTSRSIACQHNIVRADLVPKLRAWLVWFIDADARRDDTQNLHVSQSSDVTT